MKIGICGNTGIIKKAIDESKKPELKRAKICEYAPEELLLDLEEEFFDCDILFMDISLNEFKTEVVNGITLAKKVNEQNIYCQVIYISDGTGYVDEIYDTRHVYLMTRDSICEKFEKACDKAIDALANTMDKDVLEITSAGCRNYIHRNQIIYIERDGRRIEIVTPNSKYYCYESIKEIKNRLDDRMVQIYGGGIVNLEYVTYLGKGVAEISYGSIEKVFPVGRTFLKSARQAYFKFWEKDSG